MKNLLTCLVLTLSACLAGCLEFDAQDITFRYAESADRIDMLIVYRGLFAEGTDAEDSVKSAIEDLDETRARGHVAFFNNFPLAIDPVDGWRQHSGLLSHIDVESGGLFTEPTGRLCAYQFLRIRGVSAFLPKLDAALYELIEEGDLPLFLCESDSIGAVSLRALHEWREEGEPLLRLTGGCLELRMPLDGPDHVRMRRRFARALAEGAAEEIMARVATTERRASGGSPTDTDEDEAGSRITCERLEELLSESSVMRCFSDNEFAILREGGVTTIRLGEPGAEELRVVKESSGLYHDLLLQKLRERGETIEAGVPHQELVRRFTAFRGREAELPEAMRALRR